MLCCSSSQVTVEVILTRWKVTSFRSLILAIITRTALTVHFVLKESPPPSFRAQPWVELVNIMNSGDVEIIMVILSNRKICCYNKVIHRKTEKNSWIWFLQESFISISYLLALIIASVILGKMKSLSTHPNSKFSMIVSRRPRKNIDVGKNTEQALRKWAFRKTY